MGTAYWGVSTQTTQPTNLGTGATPILINKIVELNGSADVPSPAESTALPGTYERMYSAALSAIAYKVGLILAQPENFSGLIFADTERFDGGTDSTASPLINPSLSAVWARWGIYDAAFAVCPRAQVGMYRIPHANQYSLGLLNSAPLGYDVRELRKVAAQYARNLATGGSFNGSDFSLLEGYTPGPDGTNGFSYVRFINNLIELGRKARGNDSAAGCKFILSPIYQPPIADAPYVGTFMSPADWATLSNACLAYGDIIVWGLITPVGASNLAAWSAWATSVGYRP